MQIALARSLGEYMGRLSQMQPALAVCPSFAIYPVLMFSERAQKASTTDAAAGIAQTYVVRPSLFLRRLTECAPAAATAGRSGLI
jgi:hypothetical protein